MCYVMCGQKNFEHTKKQNESLDDNIIYIKK